MEFKSQLMTTDEIMRALRRIAHQITERNNGTEDVVIVGIAKGGVPIANQLSEFLKTIEQRNIPTGVLDISGHRDDIEPNQVDDALYTGRTARAAFDALSDFGRAGTIQLAVLIDRGHRELPIRADYVGKNIPTSHVETIRIDFDETGTQPVVNIYNR